MSTRISMYRGDSHSVIFTVTTDGSTALNLTGASATLSVRKSGSTYLLQETGVVSNAAAGQVTITFSPSDTSGLAPGSYAYDLQVTTSGGAVYTAIVGVFDLKEDVTL